LVFPMAVLIFVIIRIYAQNLLRLGVIVDLQDVGMEINVNQIQVLIRDVNGNLMGYAIMKLETVTISMKKLKNASILEEVADVVIHLFELYKNVKQYVSKKFV